MKFSFFLFFLLSSSYSWGYANFIGHGYTSCLNCHFNPFGGGQLNDYGRVVSATAISSRALYPKSLSDEQIAHLSGFLFRKPKQNWIRTQVNYRGFNLISNPRSSEAERRYWITMQFDARVAVKFGENDRFIFAADYGRVPYPQQPIPGYKNEKYRSRNHYAGYRITPKFGIYAGLMDKVYGLRVIEHSAFSRINPQVTQNDQTHGIVGHYIGEKWEGGVHAFMGNLSQAPELRQKGISTMFEKTVFEIHRLGASFLTSKNNFLKLTSYSIHGRFNLQEGSALLTEVGQTERRTESGIAQNTSRFALLQTYVRPFRGFYVLTNIEYLKNDLSQENYTVRWGPGLQYFPIQRLELRADIYDTRNFNPNTSTKDSWLLLFQTHIWL
jgi:hypothetical protein